MDGLVVCEPPPGYRHGRITSRIDRILGNFVEEQDLGDVLTCAPGFVLSEERETLRAPDVAFVSRERVPDEQGPADGHPLATQHDVITLVITRRKGDRLVTKETKIRAIGNSAGTTIPRTMLERLKLAEGDRVHLIETDEGILITPFDPDFHEAMSLYAEGAKRYRNAMRELAE